jgi:superfamily II DNA or RNA helicase
LKQIDGTIKNQTIPTLIDNRPGNTLLYAVKKLLAESRRLDIATGYFEIGALLDLDQEWQKLENIRLLMGDESSIKTKSAFVDALQQMDDGIERNQDEDDWKSLAGLNAITNAISKGFIQARVYTKAKFHAKAFHFKTDGIVNHGIVGSSNFTHPGLTQNVELNLFTSDHSQLEKLSEWYQTAWEEAEDLNADLLRIIEPHVREYLPFEVYLQAMRTYFLDRKPHDSVWERTESRLYNNVLAQYQRDAYNDLMHMAKTWGGAMLCDGVGLGKTFVALMLIERAFHEGHRVLVIAPKSTVDSVWVRNLSKYFPEDFHPSRYLPSNVTVMPHTDLGRQGGIKPEELRRIHRTYQTIIVDEAHHFRVPHRNRSKKLRELTKDRRTFLLTATPINNSLMDLYHQLLYITDGNEKLFEPVGIPRLRDWFKTREDKVSQLELEMFQVPAFENFLKHIIVQRSRSYVRKIDELEHLDVKFPTREKPEVINYSLKLVYGDLLPQIIQTFKPGPKGLKLVIYETERFKSEGEKATLQEQANVVGLVRTMMLKRMESSQVAFQASIEDLLYKHAVVLEKVHPIKWADWRTANKQAWETVTRHRAERYLDTDVDDEEELPEVAAWERQRLEAIISHTNLFGEPSKQEWLRCLDHDMNLLVELLQGLYDQVTPDNDDKLRALVEKIQTTPRLQTDKFVIFSEFKDTARYLEAELKNRLQEKRIVEVDSGRNVTNRIEIIRRFAPYYNCDTEDELQRALKDPIRILISTDVLSEGLNLQDANIIINYDLHWNPVRLMQRIGRVDRRMDTSKPVNYDKVYVYNFVPPKELDTVLGLYKTVSGKLIKINKALGIEAPVLDADDETRALDFYLKMGLPDMPELERLRLRAHELSKQHPELWTQSESYPFRVFSGKKGPAKMLFLAYSIPIVKETEAKEQAEDDIRWYLVDLETGEIMEDVVEIHKTIECAEGTPRVVSEARNDLTQARKRVEKEKVDELIFKAQVPSHRKARLICWMEIS